MIISQIISLRVLICDTVVRDRIINELRVLLVARLKLGKHSLPCSTLHDTNVYHVTLAIPVEANVVHDARLIVVADLI